MIEIKNKNGEVIFTYDGNSLVGADLRNIDLRRADLRNANISEANLSHADLRWADLVEANLNGANLEGACLFGVDLYNANLSGANLKNTNLNFANLNCTNLTNACLEGANLADSDIIGADLRGANVNNACFTLADIACIIVDETTKGYNDQCPKTGSFIGYKKCCFNGHSNYIVELEIPADARRSSGFGLKCRCDKAKVLSITNLDGSKADVTKVYSYFKYSFKYKVGEMVTEPKFDDNPKCECSKGIHFFMNREDAVNYKF